MDPFTYLATLISIIIGLAIANVLGGIARLIHGAGRLNFYWPSLVWAIVVFLACVQHWWSDFSMARHTQWTFGSFASVLAIPVALYLLSSLVLPQSEHADATDLREWYFGHRVAFFSVLLAIPLLSFVKELIVDSKFPLDANFWAQVGIAALQIPPLVTKREWVQKVMAALAPVYALAYFVLLFGNLPRT